MSGGGGLIAGIGKVPMWGHSPARDLIKICIPQGEVDLIPCLGDTPEQKILRFLIVGQADMRHVLQTVAKNWDLLQEGRLFLHFYIANDFLEVTAREMLLLFLSCQPLPTLGLHEKSLQFTEIFGNTLIRPKTKKTFMDLSQKLIQLLTEESESTDEKGLFDFSDLKYREKDDLVEIFKHWKNFGDASVFSMKDTWNKRVEKHLGARYDVRGNAFDWDYHMHLVEKRPSTISIAEYKKWRETGIAFADFDSDYSQPNLSLVTGIGSGGGVVLGYRGEIVTGPFLSFGIESENSLLFEKVNGKYNSTAYEVTLHNLQEMFSKMAHETKPLHEVLRVHFLSPETFGGPKFIHKFSKVLFDMAYFSSSSAQLILPPIMKLLRSNASLLVENTYYFLEFRPEHRKLYTENVFELGKKSGLDILPLDEENSMFIHFVKKSSDDPVKEQSKVEGPI